MNISQHQYSKSTKGIRDPASNMMDQQQKLIFIYPMLVDKSLGSIKEDLRSFISISILKELFISNSINMVNMASQIHPLTDERGRPVDSTKVTGNIELINDKNVQHQLSTYNLSSPSYYLEQNKSELKQQIKKRTALIKKLLKSDPKYSTYKPYIETITMDNFIDVPVIVGTKCYDIDTLTTTFVMLCAVASNGKYMLGGKDADKDLKEIFNIINSMKEKSASKLLDNVFKLPEKEKSRLKIWLGVEYDKLKMKVGKHYANIKDAVSKQVNKIPGVEPIVKTAKGMKTRYDLIVKQQEPPDSSNEPMQRFSELVPRMKSENINPEDPMNILKILKSNTSETELFWKFCLDKKMYDSMHGKQRIHSQIQTMLTDEARDIAQVESYSNNEDLKTIMNGLYIRFLKALSEYGNNVLQSILYLFWARDSTDSENEIVQKDLLKPLATSVYNYINGTGTEGALGPNINIALSDIKSADSNTRELKSLCSGEFAELDKKVLSIATKFRDIRLNTLKFSVEEYENFSYYVSQVSDTLITIIETISISLTKVVGSNMKMQVEMDKMDMLFKSASNQFISKLISYYENDISQANCYGKVLSPISGDEYKALSPALQKVVTTIDFKYYSNKLADPGEFNKFQIQWKDFFAKYLQFLFMYSLQVALCEFSKTIDVYLETAKNSITAFPNYTLVVPLESILYIANAFNAKGWLNLVSSDMSIGLTRDLSDNYIKGVIKFMAKKLGVPNLIIYDKSKGNIYYKLMYQSKPNMIKLTALSSYIENSKEIELDSSSSSQNYY